MTELMLLRRFLADYARNPANLVVLAVVPVVFVAVAAGSMADAAELLGGPGGPAVQTATAGWAAGFLAGIAMYFQTAGSREADRRLTLAGLAPGRLVAARLLTGLVLAVLAASAGLVALALRTAVDQPLRVTAGTLMFAVVYIAIGALVGAAVRNPVNGTVLILFVWILDVFFGPALGPADRLITRGFPTHFITLWMIDLPSRHGGRIGDLGWGLVWTVGAVAVAWAVVSAASRRVRGPRRAFRTGSGGDQIVMGLRMGLRDYRRNPVLWVLLLLVPAVFVLLSVAITPDQTTALTVAEGGRHVTQRFSLPKIHGGTMAPVAVASLATLAGLFVVLDSRSGDRRLALAGFRTGRLLTVRLGVLGLAVMLASVVSLAVTATVFDARQWGVYAAGIALVAATYGLVGVVLGPIFGRVSGVFIAFLLPFLDLGIGQSPMLRSSPPGWAHLLPGYGGYRVLLDGALTAHFDETLALLIGLLWLAGLVVAATVLFRPAVQPAAIPPLES
jgi:hypothetical protein